MRFQQPGAVAHVLDDVLGANPHVFALVLVQLARQHFAGDIGGLLLLWLVAVGHKGHLGQGVQQLGRVQAQHLGQGLRFLTGDGFGTPPQIEQQHNAEFVQLFAALRQRAPFAAAMDVDHHR